MGIWRHLRLQAGIWGGLSAAAVVQSQTPPARPVQIAGVASPTEEADVKQWIEEVFTIWDSPEFETNMKALSATYQGIWTSKYDRYQSPAQILDIMRLKDARFPDARYMPTAVALIGGSGWNDSAVTGWTGYVEAGKSTSYMNIGRLHHSRFLSKNPVVKSCAINTLSHEILHTLSKHATEFWMFMEDTGNDNHPDNPGEPVATYLIGSLTQCTYLQREKRITDKDIKTCLATFGTYDFRNTHCESFPNATDPVVPPRH